MTRPTAEDVAAKSAKNRESWAKPTIADAANTTGDVRNVGEQYERVAAHKARQDARGVTGLALEPPQKQATLARRKHGNVPSPIEAQMAQQLALAAAEGAIPSPVAQYKPLDDRRFRLDFAWPDGRLALEVDGAVHRIKGAFKKSFERQYLLLMAGWTVLHVGGDEVRSGKALQWAIALHKKMHEVW